MPFSKGDPNINRNGRPARKNTLTGILKHRIKKEQFVKRELELAKKGDSSARQRVWDRIEGKIPDVTIHKLRAEAEYEVLQRIVITMEEAGVSQELIDRTLELMETKQIPSSTSGNSASGDRA